MKLITIFTVWKMAFFANISVLVTKRTLSAISRTKSGAPFRTFRRGSIPTPYSKPPPPKNILSVVDKFPTIWICYRMTIVSYFFKLSMAVRDLHNNLVEKQGIPAWGSYAIFGVTTLVLGCILGFVSSPLNFQIFRITQIFYCYS